MSSRSFDALFRMKDRLGSGSFGDVYSGVSKKTGEPVAIKVEQPDSDVPQLKHEVQWYKLLHGAVGVPFVRWYGTCGTGHVLMVMDMLGRSLESLLEKCGGKFSLKTVLMLGDQMIQRVEYLHSRGVIHRDLKPDNFLMGYEKNSPVVHIIDFGLMKRFRSPITGKHIAYREGKPLSGTPRFTSIHNHLGIEQSRRDDVEALGYILIYLALGRLPWMGLRVPGSAHMNAKERTKAKHKLIGEYKLKLSIAELCETLPYEFAEYLEYCRALRFTETPDYSKLRRLLHRAAARNRIVYDGHFDWM